MLVGSSHSWSVPLLALHIHPARGFSILKCIPQLDFLSMCRFLLYASPFSSGARVRSSWAVAGWVVGWGGLLAATGGIAATGRESVPSESVRLIQEGSRVPATQNPTCKDQLSLGTTSQK